MLAALAHDFGKPATTEFLKAAGAHAGMRKQASLRLRAC